MSLPTRAHRRGNAPAALLEIARSFPPAFTALRTTLETARAASRSTGMKLLLDANLSPRLVDRLCDAGYEATHVADLGLLTAPDEQIFEHAAG